MKSIRDILKNFKVPIPPENVIEGIIESFILDLKKKKVKIKISFQGKTIFIKTDIYTKRDVLVNQKKIIEMIKERFPKASIGDFK